MFIYPSDLGLLVFIVVEHFFQHELSFSSIVTLVADFSIVTANGTYLCTLTRLEVERHDSSSRVAVSQRHDLIF